MKRSSSRGRITGNQNPEMELIWDEELQRYVLAYICNTDQKSIFDPDMAWNQEQDGEQEPYAHPMMAGPTADSRSLPGPTAEDDQYFAGDGYGYEEPNE